MSWNHNNIAFMSWRHAPIPISEGHIDCPFYTQYVALCEFCFCLIKYLRGCDGQNKSHHRVITKWFRDPTARSGTCRFESRPSFNMASNINSLKNGIICRWITDEVIHNVKSKYITRCVCVSHKTSGNMACGIENKSHITKYKERHAQHLAIFLLHIEKNISNGHIWIFKFQNWMCPIGTDTC